jgi:hypothetical protein
MLLTDIKRPLLALAYVSNLASVTATPRVTFPINAQVPPVAYTSQPYNFVFSETTFTTADPPISYTIAQGPVWLALDSGARRFSGTPDVSAVGGVAVQLLASDATGETTTSITFVTKPSQDLEAPASVVNQLQGTGLVSSPDSLLLHPQQSFNFSFPADTFSGTGTETEYYAVSADNTPLPSWLQFDATHRSFSGSTPALVSDLATSQSYGFRLIASNVAGFAEAAANFNIVISRRVFGFVSATQTVKIFPGAYFESAPLLSLLRLEGEPVTADQLRNVDADVPAWARLDQSELSLTGTPAGAADATVTIKVTNLYGDVAQATVYLQNSDSEPAPLGTVATLNVTKGEHFSYTLTDPPFDQRLQVLAEVANNPGWVHFNPQNRTLSGDVPPNAPDETLTIPLTFENGLSTTTGQISLHVLSTDEPTSSVPPRTSPAPTTASTSVTSTPRSTPAGQTSVNKHVLLIILATLFSIVGAALVFILVLFTWRRRKKVVAKLKATSAEDSPGPARDDVPNASGLIGAPATTSSQRTPPPRPPRLDLGWPNDSIRQYRGRLSSSAQPGPLRQHRTSQIFADGPGLQALSSGAGNPSVQPLSEIPKAVVLPQGIGHIAPDRSLVGDPQDRGIASARLSRQSAPPTVFGLPQRRSGAGHGSGILAGTAENVSNRTSWRNSWFVTPASDPHRTTAIIESFPTPPRDSLETSRNPRKTRKAVPLLRIVSTDSDTTTFEQQRQQWYTQRARARLEGTSRFSNGGSARRRTSSRTAWRVRNDTGSDNLDLFGPALPNGGDRCSLRQLSWSKWSAVGPAGRETMSFRGSSFAAAKNNPMAGYTPSVASSGRFESVTSADSQVEDHEIPVAEGTQEGGRRWQTDGSTTTSPRLPFSPVSSVVENMGVHSQPGTRVADKRRRATLEDGVLPRAAGEQRGSFRFI